MNFKKANSLSTVLGISGVVTSVLLFCFEKTNVWFYAVAAVAMLLIVTGGAIKIIFYRCAHCRSMLPLKTAHLPEYCPYCGEKLEP